MAAEVPVTLQVEPLLVPRGTGQEPLSAYYARPEGEGPFPAVVVIHELFGLNGNIRDIARRFAREGYGALAVDLFSTGSRPACLMRIIHGMMISPLRNGIVGDLQQALDVLRARPEVDGDRVGAIGFCMGGTYALQLACVSEGLRAASLFYGMNPRPLEAVAAACPLVGSYPDPDFTTRAGRALDEALDRHDVPHDIVVYPETRHSFFNDRGRNYDQQAAADAWRRTLSFFEEHLA